MNQRLLFEQLFDHGPATRPQLARAAGLSLPTVNAALADLEKAGLVNPVGRPETAQGRPAVVYEANAAAGHVIGVDIGRAWLRLIVADLAGEPLSRVEFRNTARTSEALVDQVSAAVASVTGEAGLDDAVMTHAVIGSPGVYDARRGQIMYAANLPGWQQAGLTETLAQRLDSPITVDNDANLAAIGEYTYGAGRNTRHLVYAQIGTGVGLGLVLDGQLYQGFTGAAGEAGYLPIGADRPSARTGARRRGMLEEVLAAGAVVRYAQEQGMSAELTAEAVFTAARAGDTRARQAVRLEAERLAELLASITAVLDPELIVLGGGIGQNLDLLEPDALRALSQLTPLQSRLVVGELGTDAVVRGAVAIGVRHAKNTAFNTRIARVG